MVVHEAAFAGSASSVLRFLTQRLDDAPSRSNLRLQNTRTIDAQYSESICGTGAGSGERYSERITMMTPEQKKIASKLNSLGQGVSSELTLGPEGRELIKAVSRMIAPVVCATERIAHPLQHVNLEQVHIMCDGAPGPVSGRFVEVEDADGKSISLGSWSRRGEFWALTFKALRE